MVGLESSGEEGARAMQRRDAGGDQRGEVDLSLLGDEYDSVERIGEGSEGVDKKEYLKNMRAAREKAEQAAGRPAAPKKGGLNRKV